jgi:hypothetical protein
VTPTPRTSARLAVPCLALVLLVPALALSPGRPAAAADGRDESRSVLGSGTLVDPEGRRRGEVRERAGGYDLYAPDGRRLGWGRPSGVDPNRIEFFAPDGKRLFDLRLRGQPGGR